MVAVPTGIISAGFVERYTKIKELMTRGEENDVRFITSSVSHGHSWCGRRVSEIVLPPQLLLVVIMRGDEQIVPDGSTVIEEGDLLVLAGKHYADRSNMNLREVVVGAEHPWVGEEIRDLDISRRELIVSIERNGKMMIPNGKSEILKDDVVLVYRKGRNAGKEVDEKKERKKRNKK